MGRYFYGELLYFAGKNLTINLDVHPSYDEKELLARIAAGDEAAFRELFNDYHHRLGHFVQRFTGSHLLTQEIVQDVFLKIWTNRHQLSSVDHFSSYLFVSARNQSFNALKQLAREYAKHQHWQQGVREELTLNEERTSYLETIDRINAAVGQLPPQQQKVFLLSREKGMSQQEIADALGLSIGTVKKHMVLALNFLREHLAKDALILLAAILWAGK